MSDEALYAGADKLDAATAKLRATRLKAQAARQIAMELLSIAEDVAVKALASAMVSAADQAIDRLGR